MTPRTSAAPRLPLAPLLPPLAIVLHPGDVATADRGDSLETLLGSCVAIVLTDPRRTIGAACHVVHASEGPDTTHGPQALRQMFAQLRARGIEPTACLAWVAGGGHMFPQQRQQPGLPHVGLANAQWALRTLQALDIPVIGQDLGGSAYRRLRWTVGPSAPAITAVALEAPA